jgi:hypothetical protein
VGDSFWVLSRALRSEVTLSQLASQRFVPQKVFR